VRPRKNPKITGAASTRGFAPTVAAALLLAALVGSHAWSRVEGTMAGYRLASAQALQEELLREQRQLELELATRRAASRIEGDARKRLGLVEPQRDQIIPIPAHAPAGSAVAHAHADAGAKAAR
jgi:cell division protein FtsL